MLRDVATLAQRASAAANVSGNAQAQHACVEYVALSRCCLPQSADCVSVERDRADHCKDQQYDEELAGAPGRCIGVVESHIASVRFAFDQVPIRC